MKDKQQEQCPYCHHETGRKHNILLNYNFLTSDDDLIETTVANKSMLLTVGDYCGDDTNEININYCPMCGRKL